MKTIDSSNHPSLPLPDNSDGVSGGANDAANLIRHKLDTLYANEPDVVTEAIESTQAPAKARSKHQKFMTNLATSGKPFAQIQIEWHDYYKSLPDKEKHEVWEEFYAAQTHKPNLAPKVSVSAQHSAPTSSHIGSFDVPEEPTSRRAKSRASAGELKKQITDRVGNRTKLSRKQHFKSLAFGLGAGALVVLFLLFGLFNERVIAPFITPSRNVSSTPLILDGTAVVGTEDKIIIPKINVEVPVVYDVQTVDEAAVQKGLERGVVHYATTSNPGEQGGGAIFGHSSNNILNRGKYKFAFVLLSRLETGDTFYIEKSGVRYVYKIYEKKIVSPSDVSVLNAIPGKTSTMALITCDPPGTTINRLVVWGEQISPDPNANIASTAIQTDNQATTLAGNPQSLWSRLWSSVF